MSSIRRSVRRARLAARVLALGMAVEALVAVQPVAAAPADIFDIGAPVIGSEPPKAAAIHDGDATVATQTGAAQYSYPVEVPPGRQGMQPHLALSYSSQAPIYGGIAAGWSLSVPLISLDTSHGRLVDVANSGVGRQYTSSMAGGHRLIQTPEPGNGFTPYRAQNDSSFTRYQRISTGGVQPSTGYWWIAYGTDGTTYYFGDTDAHTSGCATDLISDTNAPLTREVDAFGNTVDYWYTRGTGDPDHECVLRQITWGENPNASIGAFAAVTFTYAGTSPTCSGVPVGSQSSYRTGTNIVTGASELDTISAVAFPALAYNASGYDIPQSVDYTRTISLTYDPATVSGDYNQVSCFRQLDSISETASGTSASSVTLPPITFTYGPAVLTYPTEADANVPWASDGEYPHAYNLGWGYRNLTVDPLNGASGGGWPTVEAMMLDMDGDGLPDRVINASNAFQDLSNYVYTNGPRQACFAEWFHNKGDGTFDTQPHVVDLPTLKWSQGTGPTGPERCALNYQFTRYRNSYGSQSAGAIGLCPDACPTNNDNAGACPTATTSTTYAGTCGSGVDCFGLPYQDTTLAYRWVDIDGDGLVDLIASVATGGLYRLQQGVSGPNGCLSVAEPHIFGTWGVYGDPPNGNPNFPFPACPPARYSTQSVIHAGYSMCGGLFPWFIYKNHGNGVFGTTDTSTGYGPVPDSVLYEPLPLESSTGDSSITSAPVSTMQSLIDIDGDGYLDSNATDYMTYHPQYDAYYDDWSMQPNYTATDGLWAVFRNDGTGQMNLFSGSALLPYQFPAQLGDNMGRSDAPPTPNPDVTSSVTEWQGLQDINGDGLPDHWFYYQNPDTSYSTIFEPNQGAGLQESPWLTSSVHSSNDGYEDVLSCNGCTVGVIGKPPEGYVVNKGYRLDVSRPVDVDLDGRVDVVKLNMPLNGTPMHVNFNEGGAFGPETYPEQPPNVPFVGVQRDIAAHAPNPNDCNDGTCTWEILQDALDLNGDGIPEGFDFGSEETNANQLKLQEIPTPTQPPRLLTGVDNGRGLHTDISYAAMSNTDVVTQDPSTGKAMPHTQWVVHTVTATDALASTTSTSSYKYIDPHYSADEQGKYAFRGFDEVDTTLPSGAVRVDRYDYSVDWSGRIAQTVMRPSPAETTIANEARTIDNTTWMGLGLFCTRYPDCVIITYHPQTTEHFTCAKGQSDDPASLTPCNATTAAGYTRTTESYTKRTYTTGEDLLWTQTGTLLQPGTVDADGDRQTLQDFDVDADASTYRIRPTVTTKQYRASGLWKPASQERTRWTNNGLTPEYDDVWFDSSGDLNDCVAAQANCGTTHRVYDLQTGNLLSRTKPMQFSGDQALATYAYDPRKLFVATETDEPAGVNNASMVLGYVWEYGTGTKLETDGPNVPTCATTDTCGTTPSTEVHRIEIDALGRTTARWGGNYEDYQTYPQFKKETYSYDDLSYSQSGTATSVSHSQATTSSGPGTEVYANDKTELDGHGRPLRKTVYVQGSAPADEVTSFAYRDDGTLASVSVPDPTKNDTSTVTYTYGFDSLGRPTSIRRPDSGTDPSGVDMTYDGLTTTSTEHVGAGEGNPATTRTVKDAYGRLHEVDEQIDYAQNWATTTYTYDANDNVAEIDAPEGIVTTLVHDFAGRRIEIDRTNSGGTRTWTYTYDKNGNLSSEITPYTTTDDPAKFMTTIVYDDLDRPISRVLAPRHLSADDLALFGADHETLVWDNASNRRGHLTSWNTYAPGGSGAGWVRSDTMYYDAAGVLYDTTSTSKAASFNIQRQFNLDHWLNGQPRLMRYSDPVGGSNVTNGTISLDKRGLPKWIQVTSSGLNLTLAQATRNVAGLVIQAHSLLGGTASIDSLWSYDALGRVLEQKVEPAVGSVVASQDLTYFGNDDPATLDENLNGDDKQFAYTYDFRHQLAAAQETTTGGTYFSASYAYTAGGRFHTAVESAASGTQGSEVLPRNVTYQYAAGSGYDPEEVLSLSDNNNGGAPLYSYDYDLAGNETMRCLGTIDYNAKTCSGESWTFLYDGKDQLRRVSHFTSSGGLVGSEEYWYDGDGKRTQKIARDSSGSPTEMIFWSGDSEAHYDGSGTLVHIYDYVTMGTNVARIDRTGDSTDNIELVFHGLGNGTLASVDQSTGAVNASFSYAPFGEVLQTVDGAGQQDVASHRRRFNDKYVDEISGLAYYGARYYDKISMTWTQGDPLYRFSPDAAWIEPRRANLYTNDLNNPLRYMDPDGRTPDAATAGGLLEGAGTAALEAVGNALGDNWGEAVADAATAVGLTAAAAVVANAEVNPNSGSQGMTLDMDGFWMPCVGTCTTYVPPTSASITDQVVAPEKTVTPAAVTQQDDAPPRTPTILRTQTANGQKATTDGRKLGPSGKPVRHFKQHKSRKKAMDAAKKAGRGTPAHDTRHKPGQKPHFHPTDKDGERIDDGSHHLYPD